MAGIGDTLARSLVVDLPWAGPGPAGAAAVDRLRGPARHAAAAVLVVMMIVGAGVAVLAAFAAEREHLESLGTLGTELGAVLWFGGAVALGREGRALRLLWRDVDHVGR